MTILALSNCLFCLGFRPIENYLSTVSMSGIRSYFANESDTHRPHKKGKGSLIGKAHGVKVSVLFEFNYQRENSDVDYYYH